MRATVLFPLIFPIKFTVIFFFLLLFLFKLIINFLNFFHLWSFVVIRGHSWSFVVIRGHSCVLLNTTTVGTVKVYWLIDLILLIQYLL